MSIVLHQNNFLLDLSKLIEFSSRNNIIISGGELYRPQEMQEIYYKRKLTKTLKSKHRDRLAIDLNIFDKNYNYLTNCRAYEELGKYWESLRVGNVWGGSWKNFKDCGHFEFNVKKAQQLFTY